MKKELSYPDDYGIIVIGSSAGGINALSTLVGGLSNTLCAAVFIVQHLESTQEKSRLPNILARHTPLPVVQAEDNSAINPGMIYVAQPGMHLRIKNNMIHLDRGEPVRFVRPSADVLFMSAARNYGKRVIGVVLTGTGSDGAMGCQFIKANGGFCIAQDKETAPFFDMPEAAIATGAVTHVLPIHRIADAVIRHLDEQLKHDFNGMKPHGE